MSAFGLCRSCGLPLQVLSARSWSAPEDVTCPVCDEGVTREDYLRWLEGEQPEADPYEREMDESEGFAAKMRPREEEEERAA